MSRSDDHRDELDLYRLIISNLDDYAVFVLDENRRIRTWNTGAERLLGYAPAEICGKSADAIFTPEDLAQRAPEKEVVTALEKGKAVDVRWHIRKDGTRFWGSGVMIRLDDGPAGTRGLAKILQDQTSLKLAEADRDEAEQALRTSELRFRRLIEANIIGVGISNAGGEWISANDELLRILGCSRDELRAGKVRWDEMTPDRFRALDANAMAQADREGACTGYEKEFNRSDGTSVPVLTGCASVSGLERHYVCFVLDLSEQKRTEQALRDADRRKDEFLAMLAHELRNPLAPIRTAIEVLKYRGIDGEVFEQARSTMERQVSVMARLVDDLLDVSRIMNDKVELRREKIDFQTIVSRAVETSEPAVNAKNQELTVALPTKALIVDVDPVRMAQVVGNLVNNAAKYTEENGKIWVEASRDGTHAVLTVRDNGIGIPPDRLPHIFDLFTQVDSSLARSEGGLGIGLTLVKRIAEMHGGAVAVKSDGLGKGSEFSLQLPIAEKIAAMQEATDDAEQANDDNRQRRVLVVDDNVDAAATLGMLLRILGHYVETVHSGRAALDAADRAWDVIFLDIGLPDVSGRDVARAIRRSRPNGPVLCAVTGYGQEKDRQDSWDAGFDFHFVKPVDHSILTAMMADLPYIRRRKS